MGDDVMIPTSLPPRRLRRRAYRTAQFKEALALQFEANRVREAHRESIHYVPLDPPVRAGWERFFVVRPDLRHSDEGPYLTRILALVQNKQVARRHDFAERAYGRGNRLKPTQHRLKLVDPATYFAMTTKMQRYFVMYVQRGRRDRFTGRRQLSHVMFAVRDPWKFTSRVRPHYITEERVEANYDSEEKRLHDMLYSGPNYRYRHIARHYGSHYGRDDWDSPDARREPLVEHEDGHVDLTPDASDVADAELDELYDWWEYRYCDDYSDVYDYGDEGDCR